MPEEEKRTVELKLYPNGDRELWYASSAEMGWSLPLFVEWRHDRDNDRHYALILPAVCLYMTQALVLKKMLSPHDVCGASGSWLIPRKIAEAILKKAPGITPLRYYLWPEPDCPAMPSTQPDIMTAEVPSLNKQEPYDSFVKHVSVAYNLPSSMVRIVMRAICDCAPGWMLEKRKPIDFGFCKLIAVPFRANWKEIVAFKLKKSKLLKLFNLGRKERAPALENAGLPQAMCSVHNISLKRKGRDFMVDYSIEAVAGRSFNLEAAMVEKRRQACGHASYVASFEKSVETLYVHLLDALEGYLRKTSAPFARVSEDGCNGNIRFLPARTRETKVRGVALRNIPVHIVSPDSAFSVIAEQSDITLVPQKTPQMQKVPAFLQTTDDMRECRAISNMDKSNDKNEGDIGLPLQDDGQGVAAGQSMLPCSTT